MVDDIVTTLGSEGLRLDRDCVAGVVAQLPDDDVAILAAEIEEATTAADETVAGDATIVETSVPDTMTPDTMSPDSVPALAPRTKALGEHMVMCLVGDADPLLVAEALAVIAQDPSAPDFDLTCVESLLSTFSDETLQLIIEVEEESGTVPSGTAPEEALEQALMLLICLPDPLGDADAADTAAPSTEG